jgi:CheY-like chemotaxis protein
VTRDGERDRAQDAATEAAPAFTWPDLTGIHVFLIEDNEDTRELLGDTLEHCGAVVSIYSSADAAMADLPEFVPTVFICDLSMPGLDGLSFMRRMRQVPAERGGQIPSIAITAYYEDFAAAAALEAGFNAYMTKPIKLEQLARLVKDIATS